MHGCYDNEVMVFKRADALRGNLEYYNSLPAEPAVSFPPYVLCLKDVLADRNLRRQQGAT